MAGRTTGGPTPGVDAPLLVLVGPPGAGKSTVAAALARRLDVPVRDTDADVEALAGTTVSEIFLTQGEPAFRALERQAVASALAEHRGVLALGGGAPVDPTNRELLRGHRVVFLDVGLAAAARRIGMDAPRPLLLDSPRATWTRLMDERRPVYTDVARFVVTTTELDPDAVADAVIAAFPDLPTTDPQGSTT
jgi:shikimate kinase